MKKTYLVLLILITAIAVQFFACNQKAPAAGNQQAVALLLLKQIDSFSQSKDLLLQAVKNDQDTQQLHRLFRQARIAYKKIEWATEYFSPLAARQANGAPVPEIEASEFAGSPPVVIQPDGLQVIESYLYPSYNSAHKTALLGSLIKLDASCKSFTSRIKNIALLDWQIFDALKLEVFRVITLGITGFDAPASLNSIEEAASALSDLETIIPLYFAGTRDSFQLLQKAQHAVRYLEQHKKNFNQFDRATFITGYANPLSAAINRSTKSIQKSEVLYNRFLKQTAGTLFDTDAFNFNYFVGSFDDTMTQAKVILGRTLFYDPILSKNNLRSCASCHQPDKGFTDHLTRNTVFGSTEPLARNTPTLLNAALQPALFYDSRVPTLEEQARDVIENKKEMHGSLRAAAIALWQNEKYRQLFKTAFPQKNKTSISAREIQNALASYVRSLSGLNSRFDQYMRGKKTALSAQEIDGFNLFMGKAKCATCHYMPLFNGTPPPKFIKIESEIIGVPASLNKAVIDTDMGTYNILKSDFYKHAFRTPTLRNIAQTAPYMHNGVFTTLDEVMDFYNKGGGQGMGIQLDNQTLPFDSLNLSTEETHHIIAFLQSLNNEH